MLRQLVYVTCSTLGICWNCFVFNPDTRLVLISVTITLHTLAYHSVSQNSGFPPPRIPFSQSQLSGRQNWVWMGIRISDLTTKAVLQTITSHCMILLWWTTQRKRSSWTRFITTGSWHRVREMISTSPHFSLVPGNWPHSQALLAKREESGNEPTRKWDVICPVQFLGLISRMW